jgi:hypothetical protein
MVFGYEVKNDVPETPKEKFFLGIKTALFNYTILAFSYTLKMLPCAVGLCMLVNRQYTYLAFLS